MILLDTHIWVFWMNGGVGDLTPEQMRALDDHSSGGIGVSPISCWEIALLVERGRLVLTKSAQAWVEDALSHAAVTVLPLTPRIAINSTQLPGLAHKDPADRFLIASALAHDCPMLTNDRVYSQVKTIGKA
jgi:PIN domain nuclease of toxin-antitoxin system